MLKLHYGNKKRSLVPIYFKLFGYVAIASLFLGLCCTVDSARSETVRGMYGIPSTDHEKSIQQLLDARVTSVFVPPHQQTIEQFKKAGFQIYLTLNVFGGSESWGKYPDSVPITASGKALSSQYGGVCPTHFAWREERLALLASWLKQFGKDEGIDGVWLDFIRYPGRWEVTQPIIPDTCYCRRCLELFQVEKGVAIPEGLPAADTAEWIHRHAKLQWLQWKNEQVTSFVRDARSLLAQSPTTQKIKLGVFLVPWSQGERQGAVLRHLAQDATQLARYADVLSPMVYHKMVGQPAEWVKDISEYFLDMTHKPVWPIIQADSVTAEEFEKAVGSVAQAGAEGILVYTYGDMRGNFWPLLKGFSAKKNFLPNPSFKANREKDQQSPVFWQRGNGGTVRDTKFLFQPGTEVKSGTLGISAGLDRQGRWQTPLPPCAPLKTYRLSADFFRENLNGSAYPEIEVWGQKYLLNTHRVFGQFQSLGVTVQCPEAWQESESFFAFKNNFPGVTFWLRNPELVEEITRQDKNGIRADTGFFPIGAYGASIENISRMREMGLNSAVMPMNETAIDACIKNNMHCLLSVPRDTEELLIDVNALEERIHRGKFSFYVNDEPEIHSFPRWKANDIQKILHDRFPGIPTSMAIVRPQGIPDYAESSDLFMLDQYPVPYMPMTWLSESIDQAAGHVARNRLQAVIQAFGGSEWSSSGWPRLPTFAEMNCLAFLSVIHGSRGIYFYTFPVITANKQGKKDFQKVVGRLQKLLPWLESVNSPVPVTRTMLSTNRYDPKGNAAVHCAAKKKVSEHMLLCVNTLSTSTQVSISLPEGGRPIWQEFYDGSKAMAVDSTLQIDLQPLEVKVYIGSEK